MCISPGGEVVEGRSVGEITYVANRMASRIALVTIQSEEEEGVLPRSVAIVAA